MLFRTLPGSFQQEMQFHISLLKIFLLETNPKIQCYEKVLTFYLCADHYQCSQWGADVIRYVLPMQ